MRTLIVSGGRIDEDFALSFLCGKGRFPQYRREAYDRIIGVDNGLRFLYENGISPDCAVGDFDTADPGLVEYYRSLGTKVRAFNPVKDSTDTQIAIETAVEMGSRSIVILGGTGSRLDHVLGNIQSLMLAQRAGVECELLDEHNRIRVIDRDTKLRREEQYGDYVSLIPLTSVVSGVDLVGFRYPLVNHTFTSTESAGFGVSNEIAEETAEIRLKSGIFILIESRD